MATWKENQCKYEYLLSVLRHCIEPAPHIPLTTYLKQQPDQVSGTLTDIDYKQLLVSASIWKYFLFFCCGFGLGQIVAIPIDWQFAASPLAQSTPRSFDWPSVNCVQLCINECIWPRARTQVLRILAWNVACTRHLPTLVDRVGERAGQKW